MTVIPPEAWGALSAIGAATATALGGLAVARTGRARAAAEEGRLAAEEARELSRPTGNGFAGDVRGALARIEERLDDLARRHDDTTTHLVRHLSDHARHDICSREDS